MKRKGFTLIELLAVIVVLAIIALIATPIVMNTIKNAKKGAAERTADNYIKQVETAVAEAKLENKSVPNGTYDIDGNGNLTGAGLPDGKLEINMSGNKPTSGKIKITNGSVDQSSSSMTIGDYTVSYNSTKKTYEAIEKGNTPQVEVLCTANTSKVSASVYDNSTSTSSTQEVGLLASESGAYTPGVTYTCELGDNDSKTFFVLETNGDNVSLIMDKNIDSNGKGTTSGNTVAWISDEDWVAAGGVVTDAMKNDDSACQHIDICLTNEYGPITAQKYLKNSTTGWTKLTESQISLPTGQQIAIAGGFSAWTDNGSYYMDTTLSTSWLYGNINNSNSNAPYGYWTSTANASHYYDAWVVLVPYQFLYTGPYVNTDDYSGIRPVITISKSQLN